MSVTLCLRQRISSAWGRLLYLNLHPGSMHAHLGVDCKYSPCLPSLHSNLGVHSLVPSNDHKKDA